MASENLVIELWELIQKENKEKISYNDFENDLNNALNLPRDEVDRALALMLSQAEVNPNLIGEYKGGSFVISSSFAAAITTTIKYENQFIPGKVEYETRSVGEKIFNDAVVTGALIITPDLINNMVDNYGDLSIEESDFLWDHYLEMDDETKDKLRKKEQELIQSVIDDPNSTPEEKEEAQKDLDASKKQHEGEKRTRNGLDPIERNRLIKIITEFRKKNKETFDKVFKVNQDIEELPDDELIRLDELISIVVSKARSRKYKARFKSKEEEKVPQNGEIETVPVESFIENPYNKVFAETIGGQDPLIADDVDFSNFSSQLDVGEEWRKSYGEITCDYSYTKTDVDLALITGMVDTMYKTSSLEDKSKQKVLNLMKKAISELSEIQLGFDDDILVSHILGLIAAETQDIQLIEEAKRMLSISKGFIGAVKDNKDEVVEKVINPYMDGIKIGKNLDQILRDNFPQLNDVQREDVRTQYQNFYMSILNKEQLEAIESDYKDIAQESNQNFSGNTLKKFATRTREGDENNYQILKNHVYKDGIKEEEYENAVKGKQVSIFVDREGLRRAESELQNLGILRQSKFDNDIEVAEALGGVDNNTLASLSARGSRRNPKKNNEMGLENNSTLKQSEQTSEIQESISEIDQKNGVSDHETGVDEKEDKSKVVIATGSPKERSEAKPVKQRIQEGKFTPSQIARGKRMRAVRAPEVKVEADILIEALRIYEMQRSGMQENTIGIEDETISQE